MEFDGTLTPPISFLSEWLIWCTWCKIVIHQPWGTNSGETFDWNSMKPLHISHHIMWLCTFYFACPLEWLRIFCCKNWTFSFVIQGWGIHRSFVTVEWNLMKLSQFFIHLLFCIFIWMSFDVLWFHDTKPGLKSSIDQGGRMFSLFITATWYFDRSFLLACHIVGFDFRFDFDILTIWFFWGVGTLLTVFLVYEWYRLPFLEKKQLRMALFSIDVKKATICSISWWCKIRAPFLIAFNGVVLLFSKPVLIS